MAGSRTKQLHTPIHLLSQFGRGTLLAVQPVTHLVRYSCHVCSRPYCEEGTKSEIVVFLDWRLRTPLSRLQNAFNCFSDDLQSDAVIVQQNSDAVMKERRHVRGQLCSKSKPAVAC